VGNNSVLTIKRIPFKITIWSKKIPEETSKNAYKTTLGEDKEISPNLFIPTLTKPSFLLRLQIYKENFEPL
jgi:hypothetical protein